MSPAPSWHWGYRSPTLLCRPPPTPSSLDFGYQEQPDSSGSELEEVVALRPPSSEGRAR